ncbi:50S ribosomal protein L33 [Mycoplasmopsis fermentans]|nr:50S ribosomal protein L33 [Mycoplasmopsis fermentans]ADN69332.1 50S ribosomal protein L33 [Mycoplasmopsis fermentans JER]
MQKRKVTLSCENCQKLNYSTNKSLSNPKRIEIKKFCPNCRMHTIHKEEK